MDGAYAGVCVGVDAQDGVSTRVGVRTCGATCTGESVVCIGEGVCVNTGKSAEMSLVFDCV